MTIGTITYSKTAKQRAHPHEANQFWFSDSSLGLFLYPNTAERGKEKKREHTCIRHAESMSYRTGIQSVVKIEWVSIRSLLEGDREDEGQASLGLLAFGATDCMYVFLRVLIDCQLFERIHVRRRVGGARRFVLPFPTPAAFRPAVLDNILPPLIHTYLTITK